LKNNLIDEEGLEKGELLEFLDEFAGDDLFGG
jgi:hypothetical protein